MKKFLILGLIFFWTLVLCSVVQFVFSNGDGSEDPDKPVRSKIDRHDEASTYARVLYRDDLINATRYFLEIKVPPDREFPAIASDNIQSETNIHALVRLRGVYAPRASQMKHRYRPHIKVERERHRFNEAMTQVWKLLSSSEYLVLRNVQIDDDPPEYVESMTEYPGFLADIYYVVGEVERNLAEDLIMDGYAVGNEFAANFGSRIP